MARALAEAFVRVRADTSGVRDDIRRDFDTAGTQAGRGFSAGFDADATREMRGTRGRLVRDLGDSGDEAGRTAGQRFSAAFSSAFGHLGKSLKGVNFGKVVSGAKTATVAILGLGAAAAGLNTAISAGVALAPLTGLLAGIPAAALGAAAAFGTLKLATNGMGAAFSSALGSGPNDPKKFAQALTSMAPAARSVALEVRKLRPELLGLRAAAQQNLFAPLRGELTKTVNALKGPLRQGLVDIAHQFGLAGAAVLQFARSSGSVTAVKTITLSVAQAMHYLLPAIKPVLAGFRDLAVAASPVIFGQMAGGISRAATAFGKWMSDLANSGRVEEILNNALLVLRQLGNIAVNVGGILKSVFTAAAGAGSNFLGVMGQALQSLNVFLKSAQGQTALREVFRALAQIGAALAPIIGAVVKQLGALAAPIGRLAVQLGPILLEAINALGPALVTLEPGIKALFGAFGQAVQILAPILPVVGKALSDIVVAIAPLLPLAAGLAKVVVQVLAAALKVLIPIIQPIIQAFSSALLPVLPQLSQAITTLVLALVPLATAFGPAFAKVITDLAPKFTLLATEFITGVTPAFIQFITAITPFIPQLVRLGAEFGYLVASVLPPLMPMLIQLAILSLQLTTQLLPLVPLAVGVVRAFTAFLGLVAIIRLAGQIAHAISGLGGAITGLPGKVLGALNWLIRNIGGAFTSAWRGAYNATKSWGGTVLRWISGVPGAIARYFSGAGGWLYNAGRNIMKGLRNGLWSLAGSVWSAMKSIVRGIYNLFPHSPAKEGPLSGKGSMTIAGRNIGTMLSTGIDKSRTGVARTATRLAAAAIPSSPQAGLTAAMAGAGAPAGAGGALSAGDVAAAVKAALNGIGVHLDGEPVGQIVSKRLGRQTDQRRRTG